MNKDYVLRMIEAMGLMVARIRQMIQRGQIDAVRDELRMQAERTGIDLAIGRAMDGESLLSIFMPPGASVDPTNCMLFGEVLFLDGLSYWAEGAEESGGEMLAKSRLLLLAAAAYARAAGMRYPEVEDRIQEIDQLLVSSDDDE